VGSARYRLVVEGELSSRYATVFEGMRLECAQGRTVIVGTLTDQAHLQGLLQRIAGLGLTLVSVVREDEPPAAVLADGPDGSSRPPA
jgi:hypothetical protein